MAKEMTKNDIYDIVDISKYVLRENYYNLRRWMGLQYLEVMDGVGNDIK